MCVTGDGAPVIELCPYPEEPRLFQVVKAAEDYCSARGLYPNASSPKAKHNLGSSMDKGYGDVSIVCAAANLCVCLEYNS